MADKILKKPWKELRVKKGTGLLSYERRKAINDEKKRRSTADAKIVTELKKKKHEYLKKKLNKRSK